MFELLSNKFLMLILPALLKSLSPRLVRELHEAVNQLKQAAATTPNLWDDILVALLDGIVSEIAMEDE